jgi:hypothetical protein
MIFYKNGILESNLRKCYKNRKETHGFFNIYCATEFSICGLCSYGRGATMLDMSLKKKGRG